MTLRMTAVGATTKRLWPVAILLGMCLMLVACSGGDDAVGSAATADPGAGEASQESADAATLGWVITGPDGSEFEFSETVTANGADSVNNYTYTLENGQPRQGLYTQFVDAATVEVSVTSGGPITLQLVRGTLAADGFSVDVTEVLDSQDVPTGGSAGVSGAR